MQQNRSTSPVQRSMVVSNVGQPQPQYVQQSPHMVSHSQFSPTYPQPTFQQQPVIIADRYNKYNRQEEVYVEHETQPMIQKEHSLPQKVLFFMPCIFFVLCLVFSAIILGLIQHSDVHHSNSASRIIRRYNHNLNKLYPIQSISVADKAGACPDGTSSIQVGRFSGIKAGCICNDGSTKATDSCTTEGTVECKLTKEIAAKNVFVWEGKLICVKPYTSWVFLKEGQTCQGLGMKKCQEHICVNADATKCPITDIDIYTPLADAVEDSTREIVTWAESFKASIRREVTKQPIIGFETSVTKTPCADYFGHSPNKLSMTSYPLQKVNEKTGCGKFGDQLNIVTDEENSSQDIFLTDNRIEYRNLPYFQRYFLNTDRVHLFSIRRSAVSNKVGCTTIDREHMKNFSKGVSHIESDLTGTMIASIVLSSVGLISAVLLILLRKKKLFGSSMWQVIVYVLGIALAILLFATAIHFWVQLDSYNLRDGQNNIKKLLDNSCITEPMNLAPAQYLRRMSDLVIEVFNALLATLFTISVLFVIIAIICAVIRRKSGKVACLPIA